MITVKVGKVPGILKDVVLEDGATAADALEVAQLSADGFSVTVASEVVSLDTELDDGDNVVLTKKIEGNN